MFECRGHRVGHKGMLGGQSPSKTGPGEQIPQHRNRQDRAPRRLVSPTREARAVTQLGWQVDALQQRRDRLMKPQLDRQFRPGRRPLAINESGGGVRGARPGEKENVLRREPPDRARTSLFLERGQDPRRALIRFLPPDENREVRCIPEGTQNRHRRPAPLR
jgi:hypothetical protein